MDVKRFLRNCPGTIIPIDNGEHAFIPAPLPPDKWEFPIHLWPILAEAKRQMGILEGLGRTLPNPGILLRPLEDREAIQSSRLEGTYATPRELLLFEMHPRNQKPGDEKLNDWREVLNYRRALNAGVNSELPLSLRFIRDLHKELMQGVRGKDQTPGEFRRIQVAIGMNRRFVPPTPPRLTECLDRLEKYLHTQGKIDPLVDCFLTHYQFETIHPFMDGNGRVGRLLLAIMIQRKCELTKPWMYLSGFYERNRDEYIQRLFNVSARGDWTEWIEYCLHGTIEQAKDTIQRCDRLRALRDEYMMRIMTVGGTVRLNQIVEDLFRSPYVQVASLAKQLNVTYPTAKADVDRLKQAGILKRLDQIATKTYVAQEVFDIAYADIDDIMG